jgi:hypothetical protein
MFIYNWLLHIPADLKTVIATHIFRALERKHRHMKQAFVNVAENLWKSQQSGLRYAILKVNGRQIKKSLNTDDYQLTNRKLEKDYHERTGIVGSKTLPKSFKELVTKFTRIVLPTRPLNPVAQLII